MGIVVLPTVWVAKQLVPAALLNGDFYAILNQLNGNLDASNLAALAVTTPKIAVGAVTGPKIAMGSDAQGDILFRGAANYQRLAAGTAGQVLVSGGAGADVAWGSGKVVQVVNVETGAYSYGTTVIPMDNTIPQITEGDQVMSLSITPKNAANKLRIDVVCQAYVQTNVGANVALFHTIGGADQANALLTANAGGYGTGNQKCVAFTHYMTAGEVVQKTFKVRQGVQSGTGMDFNTGQAGVATFGGTMISSITITEIA